jgi:beta-phosphoglucomutase
MKPIKWIFFDFDGTLVDSIEVLKSAYYQFLKNHEKTGSQEEFNELNGPSFDEIICTLKQRYAIELEENLLKKQYIDILNSCYQKESNLFPQARVLLSALVLDKFKLGLVTSNMKQVVEPYLEFLGISNFFEFCLYGDDVEHSKPDPEIYQKALSLAQAKPEEVLVVEDSLNGIKSAKSAQIQTVQVGKNPVSLHFSELFSKVLSNQECVALGDLANYQLSFQYQTSVYISYVEKTHQKEIDQLWSEKLAKNKSLYNAEISILLSLNIENRKCSVTYSKVSYKTFLYMRDQDQAPIALAVSGLSYKETEEGLQYLIGKRAPKVSQYPEYYEFIPSGSLDFHTKLDSRIIERQTLKELEEESQILNKNVESIKIKDCILDVHDTVLDFVSTIKINNKNFSFKSNDEYSEIKALNLKDLGSLSTLLIPTSRKLFERLKLSPIN